MRGEEEKKELQPDKAPRRLKWMMVAACKKKMISVDYSICFLTDYLVGVAGPNSIGISSLKSLFDQTNISDEVPLDIKILLCCHKTNVKFCFKYTLLYNLLNESCSLVLFLFICIYLFVL